jgi:tetratricopeptide (TPR) repeat protein
VKNKFPARLKLICLAISCLLFIWVYQQYGLSEKSLLKARMAIDEQRPEAVSDILKPALESDKTRARAVFLIAEAALALKKPELAIGHLQNLSISGPDSAEVSYWKGRLLLSAGQFNQSIQWLKQASDQKPDAIEWKKWLASACYETGERSRCLAILQQVVNDEPNETGSWLTIATIHRENLDLKEAIDAYSQVIARPPRNNQALLDGATTALEAEEIDLAEKWLNLLPDQFNPTRMALIRSGIMIRRNRLSDARQTLQLAIKQNTGDLAEIHAQFGMLAQAEGNLPEAESNFSKALDSRPKNPDWLYQRASVRKLLGKTDEAANDLSASKEIRSAIALMSSLNEAAEKEPENTTIRFQLGQIAEQLNMPGLATDWYRAALACDPGNEPARAAIQRLRLQK